LFEQIINDRDSGGSGNRITAQRGSTRTSIALGDLVGCNKGTNRSSVAESLGDGHDIGHNIPVLDGKHLTGAGKTGLHLVNNQENPILIENLPHPFKVAGRRSDYTSVTLDRFDKHRRDLTGGLGLNGPFHRIGTTQIAPRIAQAKWAAVTISIRHESDPTDGSGIGPPH